MPVGGAMSPGRNVLGQARVRRLGIAARSPRPGHLPASSQRPARHRRCVPGDVPRAPPQAAAGADGRFAGPLDVRRGLSGRGPGADELGAHRGVGLGAVEPAIEPGTGDVESDDLRRKLHEEIGRLPARYRAPVVLCHLQGKSHEEAARILQWPVGTVSGRLSRAQICYAGVCTVAAASSLPPPCSRCSKRNQSRPGRPH